MGCSICLDAFGEDTEKGTRPVALPCGHVFHRACSDGWLKACRIKNDPVCCPLCKQGLGTARPLVLWPSDFRDLDLHLQHRMRRLAFQRNHPQDVHSRLGASGASLDRYMSREDQETLLGQLLDFRQHATAYVMAVNNVTMFDQGSENRLFRLFRETAKDDKAANELESSVQALATAANIFNESLVSIEEMRKETEEKNAQARINCESSVQMQNAFQKHMEVKATEERRMAEEANRTRRLHLHLKQELQTVEKTRKQLDEERRTLVQEARQQAVEARKAKLESAQQIAQSRGEADSKVNELTGYVAEQEALRMAAEERMRETSKKNNWLADRNKLLARKLAASREELKKLRAGHASSRHRVADDAAEQAASPSASSSNEKGKSRAKEEQADGGDVVETAFREAPTPSLSSDTEDDQVDKDAQSFMSSNPATLATESDQLDALQRSLSQQSAAGAKSHDAVVIEDDDIDAEFDDAHYPMSVIAKALSSSRNGMQRHASLGRLPQRSAFAPGRRSMTASASHISLDREEEEEEEEDDSIEFLGNKRKRADDAQSGIMRPFQPGPISGPSTAGMDARMPSNSSLADRALQGPQALGPRRRRRR